MSTAVAKNRRTMAIPPAEQDRSAATCIQGSWSRSEASVFAPAFKSLSSVAGRVTVTAPELRDLAVGRSHRLPVTLLVEGNLRRTGPNQPVQIADLLLERGPSQQNWFLWSGRTVVRHAGHRYEASVKLMAHLRSREIQLEMSLDLKNPPASVKATFKGQRGIFLPG